MNLRAGTLEQAYMVGWRHVESAVGAAVVAGDIRLQDPLDVMLSQDEDVIETILPEGADCALNSK